MELTTKQKRALSATRCKWLRVALCTDPVDRPTAEAAIDDLYRALRMRPRPKVWLGNPVAGHNSLRSRFTWDRGCYKPMHALCSISFRPTVPTEIYPLQVSVFNSIYHRDHRALFASECVRVVQSSTSAERAWFGSLHALAVGTPDFFVEHLGYATWPLLEAYKRVVSSCGWWHPNGRTIVMTDRPSALHFDADDRSHAEDGPAIQYRDGFGIYCWHGVIVPDYVITKPHLMSAHQIDLERNQEVRRVMIERFGWGRWMEETHAKLRHSDETGELYQRRLNGRSVLLVKVRNSTPEPDGSYKHYWLQVPPNCKTAREAVAWTFGMDAQRYQLLRET